eukprot:TRINITY_DN2627_c0_g1_i8.p1 TRINITY_DN2627_c0_g1~~TRINITY_DN2627_c0_g1_i8.p1  ORF type:complete len:102 (-),score=19.85 TRINITY_DN2627_c0_g1_i8:362-667(-)
MEQFEYQQLCDRFAALRNQLIQNRARLDQALIMPQPQWLEPAANLMYEQGWCATALEQTRPRMEKPYHEEKARLDELEEKIRTLIQRTMEDVIGAGAPLPQ